MTYTTSAELTLLTGTTLSADTLDAIIADADRRIRARITTAGLIPQPSDDTLTSASIDLSRAGIVIYNRMTGSQTKSVKVGDITIQDDPDAAIKALTDSAWGLVDDYITINKTGSVIPGIAIVGRRGRRIGTYEEMTTAEEDVY